MTKARAYAAQNATSALDPYEFNRREPGEHDVVIDILYCGVCHSDIHTARNEWAWSPSHYPCVPGHEIIGKVIKIGSKVKKAKAGDTVGVGCMVESCQACSSCHEGWEQYCHEGATFTYNSLERGKQTHTLGGYSDHIVVNENFVLNIAPNLDLARVAPLLCAGITTYSPLKQWKIGPGKKVGIIGLGGLGHMAIKLANAMGAEVILFTTSPNKREDALKLGAHEVIISKDSEQMAKHAGSLDFILDTVSGDHDLNIYLQQLKRNGVMVLVGVPEHDQKLQISQIVVPPRILTGSLIGGIPETQEMLDFCAKHNILADVELISIQKINEAYERMLKNDVKYRFVIDMNSLKQA